MAQAVECLPSMYKSLVQNAETNTHTHPKTQKTQRQKNQTGMVENFY
jgi:hypothetical protein